MKQEFPASRCLTRRILEQHGYMVRETDGGDGALEIAQDPAQVIDLLLTDLVMPGMDGRTLVERFRVMRPGVRVVCMTGFAAGTGEQQELGPAVAALLPKPFTAEGLMRALATAERTGGAATPASAPAAARGA